MQRWWWLVFATGCAAQPNAIDPAPRIETAHLVIVGDITPPAITAYEEHVAAVEAYLRVELAPIELHPDGGAASSDAADAVVCGNHPDDCLPALSAAIVDAVVPTTPRVLRDGFVDMLSGGLGHGDVLDFPVARDNFDLAALLDDATYARREQAALAQPFGQLALSTSTIYPAGEFLAYLAAHDDIDAVLSILPFATTASLAAALDAWRAAPPTIGRTYRFAGRECSAPPITLDIETPIDADGILYTPDLVAPLSPFALRTFTLSAPTTVAIRTTTSAFRVESCTDRNAVPAFTRNPATLPAGRYFLVATGPTAQVVNTSR